jgi:hypothetical protein
MIRINFCVADNSFSVTPAPPFGDLHRQAGAQYTVWLRNEGLGPVLRRGDLGPGLRRGDEDLKVTSFDLINPSTHLPFQAKTPQTAIQMRGFNS